MFSMKILQVNNVYGDQSTGKLTKALHLGLLENGHESVVVYGRGSTHKEPGVIRLCSNLYGKFSALMCRLTGSTYGWSLLSTAKLKRIIRREKPDVVHLQCINGNFVNIYELLSWLKKKRIKTVCSLHAEFMYTANCGYAFECDQWIHGCKQCPNYKKATKSMFLDGTGRSWQRMRRAFDGFEEDCLICPVSGWTEERARQSDILKNFQYRTVLNGVDPKVFHRNEPVKKEPAKTVLHVTAEFNLDPDHIKGGYYLAQLAKRMPQVTFWVAGAGAPEDIPDNVVLLGRLTDQNALADRYRRADLMVLASKKETFSMPCAESLCCGTPVVGFRAGAPEQISMAQYSQFVEYGDVDALEQAVSDWLSKDLNRENIAAEAAEVYSQQTMIKEFLEVYRLWLCNSKN